MAVERREDCIGACGVSITSELCMTEIKTEEYNGSEQPNVNKIEH